MRETIQNANGKQFHAVSLSGGKDSTAMLLLMIERDMPVMTSISSTGSSPRSWCSRTHAAATAGRGRSCPATTATRPSTAATTPTLFSDNRIITIRQRHDKVMALGGFRCSLNLFIAGILVSKPDIITDTLFKQIVPCYRDDLPSYHPRRSYVS